MTGTARPVGSAGWTDALRRGFLAFLAVAGLGQVFALAVYAVGGTGVSLPTFLRVGWLYFGAFHHVEIVLDAPDLDVGRLTGGATPGSTLPTRGSTSLSIGVALLAVTALAVWLLFRAGRAVARGSEDGLAVGALRGAAVAPGYAVPALVLALLVKVSTPLRLGSFVTGELSVGLRPLQALVLPLGLAAVAGAAGGLVSAFEADDRRYRGAAAAFAGGWRMLVAGLVLSYGGLFLAGVLQPDEPVAALTPSTAAYYRTVFERPDAGLVILAHHLAAAPNEAVWTLVPAMGGCDGVRGTSSSDLLCYGRFPEGLGAAVAPVLESLATSEPAGEGGFGRAPAPYFLYLLVPAVATLLGGRRAAEIDRRPDLERDGRSDPGRAAALGAAAGLVFAVLVVGVGLLSSLVVTYGAAFGEEAAGGSLRIGPRVVSGGLLALAWGVTGGALGALATERGLLSSRSTEPSR